jgi:ArsR family transcriptional regulator
VTTTSPPTATDAAALVRSLKALADPARLRLVSLIAASPDRELCVCDLTGPVGLSQPTVSHHMKVLGEAGLVTREQRGKWAYFRLCPDRLPSLDAAALATLGALGPEPAEGEGSCCDGPAPARLPE